MIHCTYILSTKDSNQITSLDNNFIQEFLLKKFHNIFLNAEIRFLPNIWRFFD